ncbi:hypothetical protein CEXT_425531 [Caerostris extrusa]|uniref:Uncharacterized protein n=1 Tax=Caerostris extrusa TaxID=172846 RepID=A0AAV4TZX1_CAEEX|nr:hypothetical protein CEXT_425531 [Caerostris extrusa]
MGAEKVLIVELIYPKLLYIIHLQDLGDVELSTSGSGMGAGTAKLMSFLGIPYGILRRRLSRSIKMELWQDFGAVELSTSGSGMGAGKPNLKMSFLGIPYKILRRRLLRSIKLEPWVRN